MCLCVCVVPGVLQDCGAVFLAFVHEAYRSFSNMATQCFSKAISQQSHSAGHPIRPVASPTADDPLAAERGDVHLLPAKLSLRVLTECPLILMVILQTYKGAVTSKVQALVPSLVSCVCTAVPSAIMSICAPPEATIVREKLLEYVTCQVKTLTFLTFLLRNFQPDLEPYKAKLSDSVKVMLTICPPQAVTVSAPSLCVVVVCNFFGGLHV